MLNAIYKCLIVSPYKVISKALAMESFNSDGQLLFTERSEGYVLLHVQIGILGENGFYSDKLLTSSDTELNELFHILKSFD